MTQAMCRLLWSIGNSLNGIEPPFLEHLPHASIFLRAVERSSNTLQRHAYWSPGTGRTAECRKQYPPPEHQVRHQQVEKERAIVTRLTKGLMFIANELPSLDHCEDWRDNKSACVSSG